MRLAVPALAAALLAAAPAAAGTSTFTFEGGTNTGFVGAYTTLTLSSGGLDITITRPGATFDVNDGATLALPAIGAPTFGTLSLSPFVTGDDANPAPFVVDFSSGVDSFSVDFGDYGADLDDVFTLSLFSGAGGTGTLLGTGTFTYGASAFPVIGTLLVDASSPALSAVFAGGGAEFPNSLYYDNLTATGAGFAGNVPEPATWALLIGGIGATGGALRRRRVTVRYA